MTVSNPLAFADHTPDAVPLWFVTKESWPSISASLPDAAKVFAKASGFEPVAGRHLVVPDSQGQIALVLFGLEAKSTRQIDPFLPAKLVTVLPSGIYAFANAPHDAGLAALGWLLASYRFTRYKKAGAVLPRLCVPDGVDGDHLALIAQGQALGRDLVNTPANDMGPQALEEAALDLATRHGAIAHVIGADDLLAMNFPLIHAVGRAAAQGSRLVELVFGPENGPKVTIVGKGVTFDTGGLNIKPGDSMFLMKKDMGGAATALALAHLIMAAKLPVRLRVLLPIVENAVSAPAFRPGDIYPSRKGLSVEIGNTDAEGRLILADALTYADEDVPELLIDFATLTGAARVALGPDLPPFYTQDDALAADIARHCRKVNDPVWRLPLWEPYDALVEGKFSDLTNAPASPFAGSITAALFLRRFVEKAGSWVHFDIYAWNPAGKHGRPEGGEVQSARMWFSLLAERYGGGRG